MATYARGDRAWGICQRCGLRDRLHALLFDQQYPNLRVHVECWDEKHPQERLLPVSDPSSLWRPSPEDYPLSQPVLTAEIDVDGVQVTWTESVSPVLNVYGYRLYRSVNDGAYELVDTLLVVRDDFGAIIQNALEYLDEEEYEAGDVILYYVVAFSGTTEPEQDTFEARSNIDSVEIAENFWELEPDLFLFELEDGSGDFLLEGVG
jgi:hypothetical protein